MKNVSKGVASVVTVALIVLGLSGCAHVHTWSNEWTSDENSHWHGTVCGDSAEVSGKEAHTWDDGVITPKTVSSYEIKTFTCLVCNRKKIEEGSCTLADENGFVRVKGISLTGEETWIPTTDAFKGQDKIPTLIASDHEVTRGEFKEIMGVDPSREYARDKWNSILSGDAVLNHPVDGVSWYQIMTYCNKKSIKEGLTPCYSVSTVTDWDKLEDSEIPPIDNTEWLNATCNFDANGYRLPNVAEWEWLARGGENYIYAGSNELAEVAWYSGIISPFTVGTREVKQKKANGYGLYDMSGNVDEFVWYEFSSKKWHTCRGGSWGSTAEECVLAFDWTSNHIYYVGSFRVVRTVSN